MRSFTRSAFQRLNYVFGVSICCRENQMLSLDGLNVNTRRGGKFVPDAPGDQPADERERHEENRPPLPAVMRHEIADADRLHAAPEINESIHNSRRRWQWPLRPPKSASRRPRH